MDYMQEAMQEAYEGIRLNHGGPFGSVVVRNGKIIGRGHNRVVVNQDPTCHGEMEAIRDACKNTGSFDLSGCEIYTTAEPCPMCLGGILWSNIKRVYYGCNRQDTEKIGFRDNLFYDYLSGSTDLITICEKQREECLQLFQDYSNMDKATKY